MNFYEIMEMFDGLMYFFQGAGMIIGLLLVAYNAMVCMYGYKLFKIQLAITGGFVGAVIVTLFASVTIEFDALTVLLILGGAWLGGWLAYKLYKLGLFIAVFFTTTILSVFLLAITFRNFSSAVLVLSLIVGIGLAILAVKIDRAIIILYTAITGGMSTGFFLMLMLGSVSPVSIIFGIGFSVLGVWFQLRDGRKKDPTLTVANGNIPINSTPGSYQPTAVPPRSGEDGMGRLNVSVNELRQEASPAVAVAPVPQRVEQPVAPARNQNAILSSSHRPLWSPGAPVMVISTNIVRVGEAQDKVGLTLELQNLDQRQVVAVYMDIACFNPLKQQCQVLENISFLDLQLNCGRRYITPQPVVLDFPDIRRCEVTLRNVVFCNDEIWGDATGLALQHIAELTQTQIPSSLQEQQRRELRSLVSNPPTAMPYQLQIESSHWFCCCGQLNVGDTCIACNLPLSALRQAYDLSLLEEHQSEYFRKQKEDEERRERQRQERLAEEQRQRQERLAEEQRQNEERLAEERRQRQERLDKAKEVVHTAKDATVQLAQKTQDAVKNLRVLKKPTCPNCKGALPKDAVFCEHCGHRVEHAEEASNVEQAEQTIPDTTPGKED